MIRVALGIVSSDMADDLKYRVNGTSGGLDEHTCDDMAAQSQLPGGVARGKTKGCE